MNELVVAARFSDGDRETARLVTLTRRGDWIYMRGGPTGYESLMFIDDYPAERDWVACFGTPGRWDRCVVPGSEMRHAMEAFREPAEVPA